MRTRVVKQRHLLTFLVLLGSAFTLLCPISSSLPAFATPLKDRAGRALRERPTPGALGRRGGDEPKTRSLDAEALGLRPAAVGLL